MYAETLNITLDILSGQQVIRIPGGDIQLLELDMKSYGFSGHVGFKVHLDSEEDSVFDVLTGTEVIELKLSVIGSRDQDELDWPATLRLTARLTETRISDLFMAREYRLFFADAASVLWKQHYPLALLADGKMSDLIKAHLTDGISVDTHWAVLDYTLPVLFLGTGADGARSSFYDFIIWFTHSEGGHFYLDYAKNSYIWSDRKPAAGKKQILRNLYMDNTLTQLPILSRASINVLNTDSSLARNQVIPMAHAVAGIRRDRVFRTPLLDRFMGYVERETSRVREGKKWLELVLKKFPPFSFMPGFLMAVDKKSEYRIRRVLFKATGLADSDRVRHDVMSEYSIEMAAELEDVADAVQVLPGYVKPGYPCTVEGVVVCQSGQDGDRTYVFSSNEKTSEYFYDVRIPLWNQTIKIPYSPHPLTGQLYAPAYRDQKVLVDLYFDRAEIRCYLDWSEAARLPLDTLGNQIVLGKNQTSQTLVKHLYTDDKPEFSITRISGSQCQLLKFSNGNILIQNREEESSSQTEEKFDLTPKVEESRTELTQSSQSASADTTEVFGQSMGKLNAKLDVAISETRASLDAMQTELESRVDEITADIQAALGGLSKPTHVLKATVQEAKSELLALARF
ncbi:MAG: hypothetical protein ACR2HF_05085 [Methylococcaceae bacterium]